jgi:hypothetical protein
MRLALRYSVLLAICVAASAVFIAYAVPTYVSAQTNLGASADAMCITKCAAQKTLADKQKDPSLNCPALGKTIIPCQATAPGGGTVSGQCIYGVGCKALSASGTSGKSMGVGDLSSLMQALGSVMKALGGGQSSGGSPSPTPTGSQGCTTYYQVSTPSSDPCAYYVPSGSSNNSLNLNLGGSTNTNSSGGIDAIGNTNTSGTNNPVTNLISALLGNNSNSNTNTDTNSSGSTSTSVVSGGTVGVSSSTSQGATNLGPGGANGEIRVLPNGATIVITNQNNANNSVTAGFLGTEAPIGTAPVSVVASWCRTRPWAGNFLSFIIPATFFDSLCSLKGYQVGEVAQTAGPAQIGSSVHIQNPPPQAIPNTSASSSATTTPASPPMQVDIWAVPPTVSLGGRTTIYWNTKNAASCVETSPDGSFSHSTLAGGGATVPLSGATTFTISCMAPDGTHATDDVVVRLSL